MATETLPKFTVIVPTRARADVLHAALKTVVAQDYDNLEILVSDNFSEDDTAEVVGSFDDPRIRYINTGRRLSMSHNWEFALSHVAGGWVAIIGDDDGLIPDAIARTSELVTQAGVSAIRSSTCKYKWPGAGGRSGRLTIPMQSGTELRSSSEWLRRAMAGNAGYMDLPMLYTGGFVDMDIMHAIRQRTGSFYRSSNPDVYSAVAIASITENYLYSREPLAISGISRHSIGTSHFSRTQRDGEVNPVKHFMSEQNIPFHSDIPVCSDGTIPRSGQVILLESYLQSASLRGPAPNNLHKRQLEIIAAEKSRKDKDLKKWMLDYSLQHGVDLASALRRGFVRRMCKAFIETPFSLTRRWRMTKLRGEKYDIFDVHAASNAASKYLGARGQRQEHSKKSLV